MYHSNSREYVAPDHGVLPLNMVDLDGELLIGFVPIYGDQTMATQRIKRVAERRELMLLNTIESASTAFNGHEQYAHWFGSDITDCILKHGDPDRTGNVFAELGVPTKTQFGTGRCFAFGVASLTAQRADDLDTDTTKTALSRFDLMEMRPYPDDGDCGEYIDWYINQFTALHHISETVTITAFFNDPNSMTPLYHSTTTSPNKRKADGEVPPESKFIRNAYIPLFFRKKAPK